MAGPVMDAVGPMLGGMLGGGGAAPMHMPMGGNMGSGGGYGPINVIDNSRGSNFPQGGPGVDFGGMRGGPQSGPPSTGFGNLGMDSAYLNPVLTQRID